MKLVIHLLIIAVGAGLGLTLGLALRKKSPTANASLSAQEAGSNSTIARTTKSSFTPRTRPGARDDSTLATQLEQNLSMTSGVTRWLYWLEAMEKATLSDYPRMAQLATGNTPLLRLLGARWVELNPQHLFDTLVARQGSGFPISELQRVLFTEWPKRDVEALIAALNRTEGGSPPSEWRRSFATSLIQKDVERGLRLMSEWSIENHAPQMTAVRKWAAANPRHAAEFALAHPAGHATRRTMETIGAEWARIEPAAALEFALSKRGQFASALASSVVKVWADRNLTEAADWLAKTDATTRNRLSPGFVEGWAAYDSAAALAWAQGNLTGLSLANAVSSLVESAAARDLPSAAALVTSMPSSPARSHAAAAVMQKWLPANPDDRKIDANAIEWLSRLDAGSIRRVLEDARWRWSENDPQGLAKFIASRPPEEIPDFTYSTLARSMARRNPTETLEWANSIAESQRLSAGQTAFTEWMGFQPAAARQWLEQLPRTDSRRALFFENAVSLMVHDPGATHQLSTLNPADQVTARTYIEKMPLPEERRRELLNLLPTR